ncbi:MAG: hypothetical protein KKD44_26225, partial [Proteobacteria bacterium]|nr:hypothetical protein [Pseudomonadota bacterium]
PKTLDYWDKYIRETWNPGGGAGRPPKVKAPAGYGGGTATKEAIATTPEQAARLSGAARSYSFDLRSIAGAVIATVFVDTETGKTTVIPRTMPGGNPSIEVKREGKEFPTISPAEQPKPGAPKAPKPDTGIEIFTIHEEEVKPSEKAKPIPVTGKPSVPISTPAESIASREGLSPKAGPAGSPKPQPAPQPATKQPLRLKTGTLIKVKTFGAKVILRPSPDAPEKDKRDFVNNAEGIVARRRGELRGQAVWLIDLYPYGPKDKMVLLGEAPEGATPASGKGSLKESATLIRGIPPDKPLYRDTGAVDDIISARGKKILVTSVRDKETSRRVT